MLLVKNGRKIEKENTKNRFFRLLKFYLIPGMRISEFNEQEYEIDKLQSKRRFFRHLLTPLTFIGAFIYFILLIVAVYSPLLTIYPLQDIIPPWIPPTGIPYANPSPEHILGTTKNGYDILARIIWGTRTSLIMAVIPTTIAIGGGLILGTITAYFGGAIDWIMMRFIDIMYSLPTLIIVLILAPMVGQSLMSILIIYGLFAIAGNIRFMRALVLQVRELVYIKAAKTVGASKFRIMFKHIVPNAISPMIISFFGGIGATILGIAGLSFLGLGDPNVANWGTDINWATLYDINAFIWPGLMTAVSVIGAMLIGDGLRDAIDPRLKM